MKSLDLILSKLKAAINNVNSVKNAVDSVSSKVDSVKSAVSSVRGDTSSILSILKGNVIPRDLFIQSDTARSFGWHNNTDCDFSSYFNHVAKYEKFFNAEGVKGYIFAIRLGNPKRSGLCRIERHYSDKPVLAYVTAKVESAGIGAHFSVSFAGDYVSMPKFQTIIGAKNSFKTFSGIIPVSMLYFFIDSIDVNPNNYLFAYIVIIPLKKTDLSP